MHVKTEVCRPERPVTITLIFEKAVEARDLLEELKTWKPTLGWSPLVADLFDALKEAADDEG